MTANHKNRVNRTFAGILAALTVITATVPMFAGAEEITTEQDNAIVMEEPETEAVSETTGAFETETEAEFETTEITAIETVAETEPEVFENPAFSDLPTNSITFTMPELVPVSFAMSNDGTSFEDIGKKMGIEVGDAALDVLGDTFPGAKILVAPFKTLFHNGVDDPDPMEMMNAKLDQMDNKLDDIKDQIKTMNEHMVDNTKWMGEKMENVSDISQLMEYYRSLGAKMELFVDEIDAAETNPDLNATQKIMELAHLKDGISYREINELCNIIKTYMNNSNANVTRNMYDVLYKSKALNCMVESEAYAEAFPVAEDLTNQYVYAVLMLAECQRAADAVCSFTAEDVEALGNSVQKQYYDSFNKYLHSKSSDSAAKQLKAAADGVEIFRQHENKGTLIFKGRKTVDIFVRNEEVHQDGVEINEGTKGHIVNVPDIAKKNALSCDEIKEIVSYIKNKYPGTSLLDFFKRFSIQYRKTYYDNQGYTIKIDRTGCWQTYVLTATETITTEDYNDWHGMGVVGGSKDWDATVKIKAISITDPECKEQDIVLETYNIHRYYLYGIHADTDIFDHTYYGHSILYIDMK